MRVKTLGNGGVNGILAGEVMPGLRVTGRLGYSAGIGFMSCGSARLADPRRNGGIYQKRHSKKGVYYVKMKIYAPTNPQTPAQQANRARFAAAVAAWGGLTEQEKAVYNRKAGRQGRPGRWQFLREYLQRSQNP